MTSEEFHCGTPPAETSERTYGIHRDMEIKNSNSIQEKGKIMETNLQQPARPAQTTAAPSHPAGSPNELALRAAWSKKVLTVMSAIGTLYKDGQNQKQGYTFVSYELINARLRDTLSHVGMTLIPEIKSVDERDFPNGRGGMVTRTVIQGYLHVIDCETGYRGTISIAGADQDTTGKSLGKAFTEMVKRAEMKLFHITTVEEIDPDAGGTQLPQGQYQQPGLPQQSGYAPQGEQYRQTPRGQYNDGGYA